MKRSCRAPEPADARQLVDCCLEGDERAWQCLAGRYWPLSRKAAARVLGTEFASYAPDVAQDAFVALLTKLKMWKGNTHGSLVAWITCLTRRRALNFLRVLRRWNLHRERSVCEIKRQCTNDTDDRTRELRSEIDALRSCLTVRQRRVLECLIMACSQREIADILEKSEPTVWKDVRAIRARLAERLETVGFCLKSAE